MSTFARTDFYAGSVAALHRRDTARVIMVGPDDRVLLFRHLLRAPWSREGWLTPGGGIDPGESPVEAAVRELREETGHTLTTAAAGPAVAFDSGESSTAEATFAEVNWYFFARVPTACLDLSGQDEYERRELLDVRWWSIADLRTTTDLVFPVGLADLTARLLGGDLPAEPLRLPWEH
jgi:8-oxo-dGTP pyrophosphatase MutT (NUDIX family)